MDAHAVWFTALYLHPLIGLSSTGCCISPLRRLCRLRLATVLQACRIPFRARTFNTHTLRTQPQHTLPAVPPWLWLVTPLHAHHLPAPFATLVGARVVWVHFSYWTVTRFKTGLGCGPYRAGADWYRALFGFFPDRSPAVAVRMPRFYYARNTLRYARRTSTFARIYLLPPQRSSLPSVIRYARIRCTTTPFFFFTSLPLVDSSHTHTCIPGSRLFSAVAISHLVATVAGLTWFWFTHGSLPTALPQLPVGLRTATLHCWLDVIAHATFAYMVRRFRTTRLAQRDPGDTHCRTLRDAHVCAHAPGSSGGSAAVWLYVFGSTGWTHSYGTHPDAFTAFALHALLQLRATF